MGYFILMLIWVYAVYSCYKAKISNFICNGVLFQKRFSVQRGKKEYWPCVGLPYFYKSSVEKRTNILKCK